jgi:hypothetical protein
LSFVRVLQAEGIFSLEALNKNEFLIALYALEVKLSWSFFYTSGFVKA